MKGVKRYTGATYNHWNLPVISIENVTPVKRTAFHHTSGRFRYISNTILTANPQMGSDDKPTIAAIQYEHRLESAALLKPTYH
jgi:hypothetical protein